MNEIPPNAIFIPCEPFEGRVFDIANCQVINVRITGYYVAIRDLKTFSSPELLTPICLESGSRHGVIAAPAFERLLAGPA